MKGERRGRTREVRATVILVWVAATLVGLTVAATTRIGPIVFTLSARHGAHVGDVLAFVVAYGVALAITLRLR